MAHPKSDPPEVAIVAPTEAAWRAMSAAEREAFVVSTGEALSEAARLMGEGRRHKKAKTRTIDALGLHFRTIGRALYLAEEMDVHYPGEVVFSPDVLAVVGVEEPEDDARMAWIVADEGRGPDLLLEVLHHGSRRKDLVDNVERYARLEIPEYFVYDRLHQKILGYRLAVGRPRTYERIVPQLGRHSSAVLGLDLAIEGGVLRFFSGMAELPVTNDLIGRLNGMVSDLETRADEAQSRADEAQSRADDAQSRADDAQSRADEAAARAAMAEERATQALSALRGSVAQLLIARGLALSDAGQARLAGCSDLARLQRALIRATTAVTADEAFAALDE